MRYFIFIVSYIILFIIPFESTSQNTSIEIEKLYQLDSNFDKNIVLAEINQVKVDDKQNVYLLDYGSMFVHKFNSQGKHLRSFGGRGRGPGEFVHLEEMTISGSKLFLLDGVLNKIEVFSLEGDHLETLISRDRFGLSISSLHHQDDKLYFAKVVPQREVDNNIISSYSIPNKKIVNRYISIEELSGYGTPLRRILNSYPGQILPFEGDIYYMPSTFENIIYVLEDDNLRSINLANNRDESFSLKEDGKDAEITLRSRKTYNVEMLQIAGTMFPSNNKLYSFYWEKVKENDETKWLLNTFLLNLTDNTISRIDNILEKKYIPLLSESIYVSKNRLFIISHEYNSVSVYEHNIN